MRLEKRALRKLCMEDHFKHTDKLLNLKRIIDSKNSHSQLNLMKIQKFKE